MVVDYYAEKLRVKGIFLREPQWAGRSYKNAIKAVDCGEMHMGLPAIVRIYCGLTEGWEVKGTLEFVSCRRRT